MSIYTYQLLKVIGLSEPRLLRILAKVQVQSLDADHVICRRGERLGAFSHVLSGLVSAGVPGKDGAVTPLHIAGPGFWFGADAILDPSAVALETICLTPVRLLSVPLDDAIDAFDQEPRFAQYLAQLMCWRNQLLVHRLALMNQGSPQLRVVMNLALLAEAMKLGGPQSRNELLADSQEIPLKQSLLAAMCGVSRGMFSECVQQLAAADWIRLNYASLALNKVRVWNKFSHEHRNNRHANSKPTMPEILRLMAQADAT